MGTTIEVQNLGRSLYAVRKNGNLVEQFHSEEAARGLARKMSNLILKADRQRLEATKQEVATATPYTPKEETPAASLADVKAKLGGTGMTRIATVTRGSLTKISPSQREALINAIKYCGGRIYRGGKLIVGNVPGTKIALTLSQLYALEKRGYVTLIEENFEVFGGLVTEGCKRALGLA